MLITMLTAMYVMVRVVESIGGRFARQTDAAAPYMVSQPLPWQIHFVSHRRRSSKPYDEFDSYRRNSIGVYRKNPASMAIASASLAIPCFLSCPESNGSTANGTAPPLSPTDKTDADKAATTIQSQFRKYKKQKECK